MLLYVVYGILFLQGTFGASIEIDRVIPVDVDEQMDGNIENLSELRRLYPGYFSDWNPFSWTRYKEEESIEDQIKKLQKIQRILFEIIKCGSSEEGRCERLLDKAESLLNDKKKNKTTTTTPKPKKTTTTRSTTTTTEPTTTAQSTTTTEATSTTSEPITNADDPQNVTSEPTDATTA